MLHVSNFEVITPTERAGEGKIKKNINEVIKSPARVTGKKSYENK